MTSIKKNFVLSTAYQILVLIVPFITAPYVARVLGAENIGIYSYTHSISMYFTLVAALGTLSYGSREISRNRNDKAKYSLIFWEIELLTILSSLVCIVAWFVFIFIAQSYTVYYLILTTLLLGSMFDISWFYTGMESFSNIVSVQSLFKILGVAAIFAFVKNPSDLWLYVLIMSLSTMLGNAAMWIFLPKYLTRISFKDVRLGNHFKETLIYFIPAIATSLYTVLDKTLIGAIIEDKSESGYYEQATKIINMAKAVTFSSLNSVMGTRIAYLFKNEKFEEIKQKIKFSMEYILFFGFGICFGLISVASVFIPLYYGPGYDDVVFQLMLMSPLVIIIGISNCLGSQYYTPSGRRKESTKYIITGSLVNLVLNIFLIPRFYAIGAIVATLIAEGTISFLYLYNSNGFYKFKYLALSGVKKLIAGIVMYFSIFWMADLNIHPILIICVQGVIGVTVFSVVLFIMRDTFILTAVNGLKDQLSRRKTND